MVNVTVNVLIPEDAPDGTTDMVTLTAEYSGEYKGEAVDGAVTGSAITTVSLTPHIADVQVTADNNNLDATIFFINHVGEHSATIRIIDDKGAFTGITKTEIIASGDAISGIDISTLNDLEKYYLHVSIDGIFSPHTTTFFTKGITVVSLTGIVLSPSSVSINISAIQQLVPVFTPDNSTQTDLIWISDNPAVAAVDANGLVTGISSGVANVTATSRENLTISAQSTINVNKFDYDMSGIAFADKTVTYNGSAHSIEISGALPDGVTVSYDGNEKTEVGEYLVKAIFATTNANYNVPADMTATLTIKSIPTSSGEDLLANSLRAWVRNGFLHISDLTVGETINIYSVSGVLVFHSIASGEEMDINLSMPGVYIIRAGSKTLRTIIE